MPLLLAFGVGALSGIFLKSEIDGGVNTLVKVAVVGGGGYLAWKKWG